MEYAEFAEKCMEELKVVQARFREDFDLNSWENWFYDEVTGLLTFSTGEKQINFKFAPVGSFSDKSNTWKWSWDNTTTHANAKEAIKSVRDFGEQSGFSKLINGCFPSDEIEAWEFTAITISLLNGIGAYRPVIDTGLKLFFVATEFVDNDKAKEIKDKYVDCHAHEKQRVAFVCKHLIGKEKVGFNEAFDTFDGMELGEDDDFQAWCDKCEVERQKEGEWNDASTAFADIKLICEKCYFEMKELNLGHR
jgi:hypothetical protein